MASVTLDFGHGGKDPGAIGNGLREKDIVLNVGLEVGRILERHNVKVVYTRKTDTFLDLAPRANIANKAKTDIFVSIHTNAFNQASAKGIETFSYLGSTKGVVLARDIHNAVLATKNYTTNRGLKTANFAVLRLSHMPAALIELAFITNPEDATLLRTKQTEFALAIAKGILKNLNIKYIEKASKPSAPHWAEKNYNSLKKKGVEIHDKRFNDFMTRGEVFAMLDRIVK